jgi:CheY-like chemotaxis protein
MKTILLVDDEQQVREMFGLALRRSGYYVIEATSGVEGLEMAREHLPDLILSDILMPEGDGTTLLRDIRRDPELKSTQVVLMTGSPDLVTPRNLRDFWDFRYTRKRNQRFGNSMERLVRTSRSCMEVNMVWRRSTANQLLRRLP